MGASKKIKQVMVDKSKKPGWLADTVGYDRQYLYNALNRDNMPFAKVEALADALGCDVVFIDRETGKIY